MKCGMDGDKCIKGDCPRWAGGQCPHILGERITDESGARLEAMDGDFSLDVGQAWLRMQLGNAALAVNEAI